MSQAILARLSALEARVAALESGDTPSSCGTTQGSGGTSGNGIRKAIPLDDGHLEKSWADKKIAKDHKDWKGRTQVGRTYSQAPVEWLEKMAGLYEWKAQKGREENPPRLRDDGKPWHENDMFEARLLRAWAKRNANKSSAPKTPAPAEDEFGAPKDSGAGGGGSAKAPPPTDDFGDFGGGGDDDIPFGINATLYGRWDRP